MDKEMRKGNHFRMRMSIKPRVCYFIKDESSACVLGRVGVCARVIVCLEFVAPVV